MKLRTCLKETTGTVIIKINNNNKKIILINIKIKNINNNKQNIRYIQIH